MLGTAPIWICPLTTAAWVLQRCRILWVSYRRWCKACTLKMCIFRITSCSSLYHPYFVSIARDSRAIWGCVRFVSTRKWNKFCNFFKCTSIFWCSPHWVIELKGTVVVQAKLGGDRVSDTSAEPGAKGCACSIAQTVQSMGMFCWRLCPKHRLHRNTYINVLCLKEFTGNMRKEKVVLSFGRGNEALICMKLHMHKSTGMNWQQMLLMFSSSAKAWRFSFRDCKSSRSPQTVSAWAQLKCPSILIVTNESWHRRLPHFYMASIIKKYIGMSAG